MQKNKQETELKLSKNQLQSVINTHIQEAQGLNDLFAMMVNGLMLKDRCKGVQHCKQRKLS